MNLKALFVILAVVAAFICAPAFAREGLYFGASVPKTKLSGDIFGLDSGTGLSGRLGLGIGRYLGVSGELFRTSHDAGVFPTKDFKGGTIDLKIYFPMSGSRIEPYLTGGVGKYVLENALQTYRGEGGHHGVGIDLYLFPELSLNAGYTKRNITFDSGTSGVDLKGKARTIDLGITYHFL